MKEFWKAYDAAAETNAGLGVGGGAKDAKAAEKPAAEAESKDADALADSLAKAKVADKDTAAA